MPQQPTTAPGIAAPIHGVGIGLRSPHYTIIEQTKPAVPWFEVLIDNYLNKGGSARQHLHKIRQQYPITFHGVSMSIGSADPINRDYLLALKLARDEFEPVHISDHLCWSSINGQYSHDLLPLPYVEKTIQHVVDRIQQVQDFLQQQILIENVSSYLQYSISAMHEWEFLVEIVERADCYILLDINNIYVSAYNHSIDPVRYLEAIPAERIREMHLAGYEDQGTHLLDTHSQAVHPPVWQLYEQALQGFGPVPTLIEWDNDIPDFAVLQREANTANRIMHKVCRNVA